jgi:hypothetical protein
MNFFTSSNYPNPSYASSIKLVLLLGLSSYRAGESLYIDAVNFPYKTFYRPMYYYILACGSIQVGKQG